MTGLAEEDETGADAFLSAVRSVVADGPKPRQMVLTLLADYWLSPGALTPSGAVVELSADFGISQSGCRTVLGRLARDDRVVVTRDGRRTLYQLAPWFHRRLTHVLERLSTFGREPGRLDHWTCVAFSVPEDQRATRHKLRAGLQWLGFAPLYDGLWVCPRAASQEADALVTSLGITAATLFESDLRGIGSAYGRPTDAWDLAQIRRTYRDFLDDTRAVLADVRARRFDDRQALVWRTELMNVWRAIPTLDPGLPTDLLPSDWPRAEARAVFEELYTSLAAAAERRVRSVVERHAPACVDMVHAHGYAVDNN